MSELSKECFYTNLEQVAVACDIPFLQWVLSRISVTEPEIRDTLKRLIAEKIAWN